MLSRVVLQPDASLQFFRKQLYRTAAFFVGNTDGVNKVVATVKKPGCAWIAVSLVSGACR